MTLKSPNEWQSIVVLLEAMLNNGMTIGDALREVAMKNSVGAMSLCKAVASICSCSHREAAKIVAHEVTGKSL